MDNKLLLESTRLIKKNFHFGERWELTLRRNCTKNK